MVFNECKDNYFLLLSQIFILILLAMSSISRIFETRKQQSYRMEDFVHLHVHTYYSVLDGQSKIPNLVDKAIKNGMKGMTITDHGVMFGIKEFSDYCANINKKRKKNGEV